MNRMLFMKFVRTAASATFLAASLLFAALLARSYSQRDSLITSLPDNHSLAVKSSAGKLLVGVFPKSHGWHVSSQQSSTSAPQAMTAIDMPTESHFEGTPLLMGTIVV